MEYISPTMERVGDIYITKIIRDFVKCVFGEFSLI